MGLLLYNRQRIFFRVRHNIGIGLIIGKVVGMGFRNRYIFRRRHAGDFLERPMEGPHVLKTTVVCNLGNRGSGVDQHLRSLRDTDDV